jgi:hypothetical protein
VISPGSYREVKLGLARRVGRAMTVYLASDEVVAHRLEREARPGMLWEATPGPRGVRSSAATRTVFWVAPTAMAPP